MNTDFDSHGIFGSVMYALFTVLGFITANSLAVLVGIAVGATTVILNAVKIYNEIQQGKKLKQEIEDLEEEREHDKE